MVTTWIQRPFATLNSGKIWFVNGSSTIPFRLNTSPAKLIWQTYSQKKYATALIFVGFGTPCLACPTPSKVLSWCFIMLVKQVLIKLLQLLFRWLCWLVLLLTSQLLLHPCSVGLSPQSLICPVPAVKFYGDSMVLFCWFSYSIGFFGIFGMDPLSVDPSSFFCLLS